MCVLDTLAFKVSNVHSLNYSVFNVGTPEVTRNYNFTQFSQILITTDIILDLVKNKTILPFTFPIILYTLYRVHLIAKFYYLLQNKKLVNIFKIYSKLQHLIQYFN